MKSICDNMQMDIGIQLNYVCETVPKDFYFKIHNEIRIPIYKHIDDDIKLKIIPFFAE